jgi:hypothetical protein
MLRLGPWIGVAVTLGGCFAPKYSVSEGAGGGGVCSPDTSFASDAHNCGACGRDCLDGPCSEGECQPVVFAPRETYPLMIALDATSVYWVDGEDQSRISKTAKLGGAPIERDFLEYVSAIAVDGPHVYFALDPSGKCDGQIYKEPFSEEIEQEVADACDPGVDRESFDADPENCGACGHDCLGGTCVDGACRSAEIDLVAETEVHAASSLAY